MRVQATAPQRNYMSHAGGVAHHSADLHSALQTVCEYYVEYTCYNRPAIGMHIRYHGNPSYAGWFISLAVTGVTAKSYGIRMRLVVRIWRCIAKTFHPLVRSINFRAPRMSIAMGLHFTRTTCVAIEICSIINYTRGTSLNRCICLPSSSRLSFNCSDRHTTWG